MRCAMREPVSSAAASAVDADAAATARTLTSSCMWNITKPPRITAASGSPTASSASPTSCRRTVGRRRSASASTTPAASVESDVISANSITA